MQSTRFKSGSVCWAWVGRSLQTHPPSRRGLRVQAVFAEHLRPVRRQDSSESPPRGLLFAVDDSDATEDGARFTLKHIAKPGDCVHFVHVIADSRVPFVSVGDVGHGSQDVYYSSSVDVFEAFPLEEHQNLLEMKGEQMLKRRLVKNIEQHPEIKTKYHLPIMTRPESASEIASVVSELAAELKVDLLTLVSPSSGVFLECGSVGYHCYEQSPVPVVLLPNAAPYLPTTAKENVILVLVNSEPEKKTAEDWIATHMSHIFHPYKFFIACLNDKCTMEIPQSTKEMAKELERTQEKLHPACVVMYASSEKTVLDQLGECPFVADYDEANRYTMVLLPKWHPETHEHRSYWSDYTYSEDEILQT